MTTLYYNQNDTINTQTFDAGIAQGTANNLVLTVSGTVTLSPRQFYIFTASQTNTGPVTISINGGSSISVVKNQSTPLAAGDIVANKSYTIVYGTSGTFELQGEDSSTEVTNINSRARAGFNYGGLWTSGLSVSLASLYTDPNNFDYLSNISGLSVTAPSSDTNFDVSGPVQVVRNVATLRGVAPIARGRHMMTRGYYSDGDSGECRYRPVTGASAGTYVDNGISTIVPTGGNGSSAWIAMFPGRAIRAEQGGAKGDGVTSDTTPLQAIIDYLAGLGGGIVYLTAGRTYFANIVLKQGVTVRTDTGSYGYLPSNISTATIKGAGGAWPVDTPSTSIVNCGIIGVNVSGVGAGPAYGGIRFQNVSWGAIKTCAVDNCGEQAILLSSGLATAIEDILVTNAVLNRTRSQKTGAIEIASPVTDCFLHRIESSCSLSSLVSSNQYICSILIAGTNNFIANCVGEYGEEGLYVSGSFNRIVNVRPDLNFGNGMEVVGGSNDFTNVTPINNGRQTTNTYDGMVVSGTGNKFINCVPRNSSTPNMRYCITDTVNSSAVNARNTYLNCDGGYGYTTGYWNLQGFLGSAPIESPTPIRPADGTTIIDTTGTTFVVLKAYVTNTTVTNFTGGFSGKTVKLVGDANVTIANNANIKTNTGANKTLSDDLIYEFTYYNGLWSERA